MSTATNLQDANSAERHRESHSSSKYCPTALHHLHTATQSSAFSLRAQTDHLPSISGNGVQSRPLIEPGNQTPWAERFVAGVSMLFVKEAPFQSAISFCCSQKQPLFARFGSQ